MWILFVQEIDDPHDLLVVLDRQGEGRLRTASRAGAPPGHEYSLLLHVNSVAGAKHARQGSRVLINPSFVKCTISQLQVCVGHES